MEVLESPFCTLPCRSPLKGTGNYCSSPIWKTLNSAQTGCKSVESFEILDTLLVHCSGKSNSLSKNFSYMFGLLTTFLNTYSCQDERRN